MAPQNKSFDDLARVEVEHPDAFLRLKAMLEFINDPTGGLDALLPPKEAAIAGNSAVLFDDWQPGFSRRLGLVIARQNKSRPWCAEGVHWQTLPASNERADAGIPMDWSARVTGHGNVVLLFPTTSRPHTADAKEKSSAQNTSGKCQVQLGSHERFKWRFPFDSQGN